nr:MAG TPA: hypothetical protein [Caudoviricetes sp.]
MAIYCRNGSVLIIFPENDTKITRILQKFLNIVIAYQLYTAHISLLHAVPE